MSSNPTTTTTEPAPKRHRLRKWLLIAFGALVLLVLVGRLAPPTTTPATAAPAAPATVAAPPTVAPAPVAPAPAAPATSIGEEGGTYAVGVDIAPGTYHTAGSAGLSCYWQRERSEPDKYGMTIITNGASQGPATVTIKATDAMFMTTGCKPWVKR